MADFSLNVKINGAEQVINTVGQIEEALRQTREELKNVAIGSAEFQRLSDQAVNLQREFVNSYKETTNFNRNIQELGQSVGSLASTITSAFTIATTAFSLFAGESEELTQTQVKAQQALALALSATTIAVNAKTIAEDINNVGLALQNGLTKILTLAIGQQTVATAAQAVATGTATVAQRALNAAMAANPIGLVIAAVAALVAAFVVFGKEEEKEIKRTKDLNGEIDNNTKSIQDNIKTRGELIQLEGRLAEAQAKTDAERLEARIETQRKLDQLNVEDVKAAQAGVEQKIANYAKDVSAGANYVKMMINQTKELQDFNLDSKLSAEEREYAALIRARENNFITEKAYTEGVIAVYQKYFDTKDEQRMKDFEEESKNYRSLLSQRTQFANDLKVAEQTITTNEQLANAEREKQRQEDYKKYKDNLKKRKDELESYNKDVEKLEKDRANRIKEIERELEDFQLDRISLVKTEDGAYREDLIAGYDETIAKLKVARDRDLVDQKASFEESLKSFEETEKKRVDNNGKRIVSDKTINDEIARRRKQYAEDELLLTQSYATQITTVEEQKAQQILEINNVLNNELVFGDNNMNDTRAQIALNNLNFQLDIKMRELELERKSMMDKIVLFNQEGDEKRKSQVQLLQEIQALQAQQRDAERKAQLAALQVQKAEDLKNVQGTEEQKGKQRNAINEYYKNEEAKINENFRLKEKEADRKNLEDIWELRNQNLEKWTQFGAQVANTLLDLFSSFNELAKVNSENYLMEQRDLLANQTSALNEEYNRQRASLDENLAAGIISQQQYNETIKGLDSNLTASTEKLNKEYRAKELAEKKKAFENEKKLKIAQAIISGLQGAVTAFTGAFTLGPIAGPIVGGILAGLVAATTAVQVAAIAKTKFDGGAPEITPPNTGGAGAAGGGDAAAQAITSASSGGFTGFNQGLVGQPGAGATTTPISGGGQMGQRVYVLESDITNTQRRVETLESNATFG